MIGVVLVTHGELADQFRAALEHVVGAQQQLRTIAIGPDDNMEDRRRDIMAAVKEVEAGKGTIIATDMFGGTPSNLAISVLGKANVEVIAGINLPMLIKLASLRESEETDLMTAVRQAQEAGRKYISIASEVMADRV